MHTFIELTEYWNKDKIWVNMDKIVSIRQEKGKTYLIPIEGNLEKIIVTESPSIVLSCLS